MWPGLTLARCQLVTTATTTRASRVTAGSFRIHAVAITPPGLMELIRSYFSINVGLPQNHGGSAPALIVSRPAQRVLTLRHAGSASRVRDPGDRGLQRRACLPRRSLCSLVQRCPV